MTNQIIAFCIDVTPKINMKRDKQINTYWGLILGTKYPCVRHTFYSVLAKKTQYYLSVHVHLKLYIVYENALEICYFLDAKPFQFLDSIISKYPKGVEWLKYVPSTAWMTKSLLGSG